MSFNPENYKDKYLALNQPHDTDDATIEAVSEKELRQMGMTEYVYVKPVSYETLKDWTQGSVDIDRKTKYFALYAADGTPVVVADDQYAAMMEASEREMQLMALH